MDYFPKKFYSYLKFFQNSVKMKICITFLLYAFILVANALSKYLTNWNKSIGIAVISFWNQTIKNN